MAEYTELKKTLNLAELYRREGNLDKALETLLEFMINWIDNKTEKK